MARFSTHAASTTAVTAAAAAARDRRPPPRSADDRADSDEDSVGFDSADDLESGFFGEFRKRNTTTASRTVAAPAATGTRTKKQVQKQRKAQQTAEAEQLSQYQYRTAEDLQALQRRVAQFRTESRRQCILLPFLYRPLLADLLRFLAFRYRSRVRAEGAVPYHAIRLEFRAEYGDTYAVQGEGRISFSLAGTDRNVIDDSVSDYPEENRFRKQWVRTKEDALVWLLLHEFQHLLGGESGCQHSEVFFARVHAMARENPWLFSGFALAEAEPKDQ